MAFSPAQSASAAQPNVLLIITDDQGYGDFGFTGNKQLDTPVLDKLAAQSVRFDRFYVTPFCAPTRAALLTGRYPLQGGVHGVARGEETLRSEETTIAEILRKAGYRTGLFGKWHNGENYPYTPNGQGFDEALGFNLGHWNNYFDPRLRHNAGWTKGTGYISDVLTDAAIEFIGKNRAQPWLCYLPFNAPHTPYQCPDREFAKYKARGLDDALACIYGMVENIDTNIGRALAKLDEWQLAENTIVIFLTDNGPNGDRYTAGLRGKKGSLYEGGSRTPLLVRWPARLKEARVVSTLAHAIDILPTVCELTGTKPKTNFPIDGRSLVPLLEGSPGVWPEREIFIQNRARSDLQRTQGTVITQRFTAVNNGRDWELYDLQKDPGQQTDLAKNGDARMIVDDLSAKFERWWSLTSAGVTRDRPPVPVGHRAEPIVEASAAQAELIGGLKYNTKAPNNAWIIGWDGADARAEWTVAVAQPGPYEIGISFNRDLAEPALKLRAETGGQAVEVAVPQAIAKAIPQPDRAPRNSESPDSEWHALSLGRVNLTPGEQTITVRLTLPDKSFALQHLSLRRVE
ncbi:MAG: arylsulfatase [Chthoniobacteraceae bacterium]